MLNENKNIDRIFREKVGDYEKTPPLFLWTNIQAELNSHRKVRRIALLKTVAIAAAIVLAFLAGWWTIIPSEKNSVQQNSVAERRGDNNVDSLTNKNTTITNIPSVSSNMAALGTLEIPPKPNRTKSSDLSSPATFAANTSFIGNDNRSIVQKSGQLELSETEKDFLNKMHQNFGIVKKLTDWITSVNRDSLILPKKDLKVMTADPFKYNPPKGSVAVALNNPDRYNGRWSLKAEFAPVFNSQPQNGGQRTDFISVGSQNYNSQETTSENTFSGGMVAGYKVGKRLIVKSGIVYNNIRQTTRNVDLSGVNPLYYVSGNASLASTPSGQVSLNKMAIASTKAILNSNYQLDNTSKSSIQNELKQDIEFIEIPVQATYKLIDTRFNVGITGGISTNFLVGNKAILSENSERISSGATDNMRNVVYSGAVGLEIGYEITNRITFTVEPRLKHFINSLSTSNSVNYKPNSIGIVTGLTYSFN